MSEQSATVSRGICYTALFLVNEHNICVEKEMIGIIFFIIVVKTSFLREKSRIKKVFDKKGLCKRDLL